MKRFTAELEPVPHGGLCVVVPGRVAAAACRSHGVRVRGTVDGVAYRSSLMKYSDAFHLGVHKATAAAAGVTRGDRVRVTIGLDDEPLPTDALPEDLSRARARNADARTSWSKLPPAVRRGYVKLLLDAKRDATRARRVARIVETLQPACPRAARGPPGGPDEAGATHASIAA